MKKRFSLVLCVLMLASLLAAPVGSAGEGSTLTVLVEGGSPANAVVEATKAAFTEQTGCEIVVDAVPYSGIYDKVMAEISSGTAQHDLICIDVLWFAAMKPGLAVLNDVVTEEVKNDSMPGLIEGATLDGELMGYPLWTNCQLLIYRKDLFEDEANKTAFAAEYGYELAPPTTWAEYADMAKFFTKDDMYGTALHGLGPHAPTQFLNFACQAGAQPLVLGEDGMPNVDGQPYVDALAYMQQMQNDAVIPPDTLAIGADECNELFGNEKIAMQLNWAHLYASSYEKLGGDKVGVASNIGGSAGVGAISGPWYMSVMKNSPNQDLAMQYMNYMFDNNAEFLQAGLKVSARVSDFEEYGTQPEYAHLTAMQQTLGGPASQSRPNTEKWAHLEDVIIGMVQNSFAGQDPAAEAQNGKAEMDAIVGG